MKLSLNNPILFCLICFLSCQLNIANAATITVNSIATLQTTINNAAPGTIIILTNNTFSNATLTIPKSNLTIKAATNGGVIFNGASTVTISGSNNTFSGFQFKGGDIGAGNIIEVNGNANTITNCNFQSYGSHNYIHTNNGTTLNVISYCNFQSKPAVMNAGPAIQVSTSSSIINYTKIRYCSFLNFLGSGGDFGNEAIRIGLSNEQNNISGCIVEYCYFENTGPGDSESISVKSKMNLLRYNTQNNNLDACFVFRSGNQNTAYGNYFINSGGIRVKEGHNHMIYNNYFQNGSVSQGSLVIENYFANPIDTLYIYHNTFYKPGNIQLGGNGAYPPKNVKFANNIFYKTAGVILSDLNTNVAYFKNIYNGGASLGKSVISSEFTNVNPLLTLNANNVYSLSVSSPAINTGTIACPALLDNVYLNDDSNLLLDIEGQSRITLKDIGCDEYSTSISANKPLQKTDVGCNYSITARIDSQDAYSDFVLIYPNPTYGQFYISSESNLTELWLFNLNGICIYKSILPACNNAIDISGFSNGIYLYKIKNENGVFSDGQIIKID